MTAESRHIASGTGQPAPPTPPTSYRPCSRASPSSTATSWSASERITGEKFTDIRVVGGGSRNRVLNQFTADATGCRVTAGPIEATALGNLAMQMVGTGAVSQHRGGRALIDRSFPTERFEPRDQAPWDAAYARIRQIAGAAASGK